MEYDARATPRRLTAIRSRSLQLWREKFVFSALHQRDPLFICQLGRVSDHITQTAESAADMGWTCRAMLNVWLDENVPTGRYSSSIARGRSGEGHSLRVRAPLVRAVRYRTATASSGIRLIHRSVPESSRGECHLLRRRLRARGTAVELPGAKSPYRAAIAFGGEGVAPNIKDPRRATLSQADLLFRGQPVVKLAAGREPACLSHVICNASNLLVTGR